MSAPHLPFRLDGRVAWITGSSRGLGRIIAETLAAAGARTVVNCFASREQGLAVVDTIRAAGGEALQVLVFGRCLPQCPITNRRPSLSCHQWIDMQVFWLREPSVTCIDRLTSLPSNGMK